VKVAVTPRGTHSSKALKTLHCSRVSMKPLGLVGGTFDRFHIGHQKLLEIGLKECHELEVWMTSDILATRKDRRIDSWADRKKLIMSSIHPDLQARISFHTLEDAFGPAPTHEVAEVIICTPETISNCEEINAIRANNELKPLHTIMVDPVLDSNGRVVSSTNIRMGITDRDGMSWLNEQVGKSKISLNTRVEAMLKSPFGTLVEGNENEPKIAMMNVLDRISGEPGPIIAVGDVTVKTMQDLNKPADIAIIDGMTKRERWEQASEIDEGQYDYVLKCKNPAGSITPELYRCCYQALVKFGYNENEQNTESTIIIVDGEEDLAPLILHPLAPMGSVILYGQPGRGVVIRFTDLDSKSRCRELLDSMNVD